MPFESGVVEESGDGLHGLFGDGRLKLALPYYHGAPSEGAQLIADASVAFLIALELALPEICIGVGSRIVAASFVLVPEASVDENGCARDCYDDVGFAWERGGILTVAIAMSPKPSSGDEFGFGVLRVDGSHNLADALGLMASGGHLRMMEMEMTRMSRAGRSPLSPVSSTREMASTTSMPCVTSPKTT